MPSIMKVGLRLGLLSLIGRALGIRFKVDGMPYGSRRLRFVVPGEISGPVSGGGYLNPPPYEG